MPRWRERDEDLPGVPSGRGTVSTGDSPAIVTACWILAAAIAAGIPRPDPYLTHRLILTMHATRHSKSFCVSVQDVKTSS
jgi:hypothetical protein